MAAKYRHGGSSAALGTPAIAYAEGRCVGGSTEINSGLYHRCPAELAEEWRPTYRIDEFTHRRARPLRASDRARAVGVAAAGRAAGVVGGARAGRDQARLAGGRVPAGVPVRGERARREADDGAHAAPRAIDAGAASSPDCRVSGCSAARRPRHRRAVPAPPPTAPTSDSRSAPSTCSCAAARSRRRRCSNAAASGAHRPRPQAAPDDQDRGPLPASGRPRRRADAPGHRVRAEPHDRRIGQPPRSRRARARRLGRRRTPTRSQRLGARRRLLRGDPQRRPAAGARAARACARRSSPTASPKPT